MGVADALFTRTQQRVLGLLFASPDQSFYTNQVVRLAGMGIGAVQRELQRLEAAGLVTTHRVGNQKHYQANREAAVFEELRGIVVKTFGVAGPLREALAPLAEHIQAAFIYGSVARGTDTAESDIDLMVIADTIAYPDLIEALSSTEEILQRPVNPTLYAPAAWRRKLAEDSGFVTRVVEGPKVFVMGEEGDVIQAG